MGSLKIDYEKAEEAFLDYIESIQKVPDNPAIFSCPLNTFRIKFDIDLEDYESDIDISVHWEYEESVKRNSYVNYPLAWNYMNRHNVELNNIEIIGKLKKKLDKPNPYMIQKKLDHYFTPNS